MSAQRNINLLMFGWEFPPFNSGGLGTACFGLTRALVSQDVDVTFVLPHKVNISTDTLKILFADTKHIKITSVDTMLYPYITEQQYNTRRASYQNAMYAGSLFEEVYRYARRARSIAKKTVHNVIHAHDWLSFGAGIEAKKVSHQPLVTHVHATEFDRTCNGNVNQYVYDIEREGMEKADRVVAVSQFTKNILTKHYGIKADKIDVVHNAIDPEDYKHFYAEDVRRMKAHFGKIVLFAGRLTLQKGPDWFLKAAKRVLEFMPDVTFIVAGSGDMERQIIRQAAYYGISNKIFFTGFLRGDELNKIYQAADLYVMPSVSEPFGITPLESLANGSPVIVSKQSGVAEILSHVLKADFWDVDDMANKIISVLQHDSLQENLKFNGHQEAKRVSWRKPAQQCVDIYHRLLA